MFGIKTKIINTINKTFSVKTHKIPSESTSLLKISKRFYEIKNEYSRDSILNNLGWLNTPPKPLAVWAYKFFLNNNQNHLGNWSNEEAHPWGTQKLEQEVVRMLTDLYHAKKNDLGGYVTSGGTEGNLFSIWTGRKFLNSKKIPSLKLCIIQTDITHYSIKKNADITNIDLVTTPLNSKYWDIDPNGLIETVNNSYNHGYRGFLIPLTLGYTQTGTSDSISKITSAITKFKKQRNDVFFYVWIDAAFSGLVEPFLDNNFSPFSSPLIQAFVVDFHKFGGVPYSAGVVLYKKNLTKLIENDIPYLPETDSTISGSRSGAPVAAIWAILAGLGRNGLTKIVNEQMNNKKYFIESLRKIYPAAEIITSPNTLTCGVIFNKQTEQSLSNAIKDKYGLFAKKNVYNFYNSKPIKINIYKFYFLPHLKFSVIKQFFRDLTNA